MPNPFLALFAYALIALCAVLAWLLVRRSSFNNRCYVEMVGVLQREVSLFESEM